MGPWGTINRLFSIIRLDFVGALIAISSTRIGFDLNYGFINEMVIKITGGFVIFQSMYNALSWSN